MALDTRNAAAARDAATNAVTALLNSGKIRLYTGTRPTNADTAIGAQVLLGEGTFGATAFGASSAGTATSNAITGDSSADASGTATWARLLQSNGTTAVQDVEVGTSGANLNMNSNVISAGAAITFGTITLSTPIQGA